MVFSSLCICPLRCETLHKRSNVLQGLSFCYRYIDDLLITSSSLEEHLEHLGLVLQRLHDHGIVINVHKNKFGVPSLDFLGYHVDSTEIWPLDNKIEVIRDFPQPTNQRKLQFLGLVNFYRRFIPHGASLLQHLSTCSSFQTFPQGIGMERVCHHSFQRHQRRPRSGHPASAPESWGSHEHYDRCLQHCSRSCVTAVHRWPVAAVSVLLKKSQTGRDIVHTIESCWQFTWPSSTCDTSSKAASFTS